MQAVVFFWFNKENSQVPVIDCSCYLTITCDFKRIPYFCSMKILLTSILLLIVTTCFSQDPPEKYQKIWQDINEGDGTYANKELDKIIRTKPKDPWPYWLKGISMHSLESEAEQCRYFELAITADSTFAPAYYNLASKLSSDSSTYSRAEKLYTKAIELASDEFYYIGRGELYFRQKRYDEAIKDAKMSKLIDAANCYFANKLIIQSLYQQGKTADLKLFLKLNNPNNGGGPPDEEYQYFLGELYESWGEPAKACPYFRQAVEDAEFMAEMADPGTMDQKLEQYRTKAKAICK